MTEAAGLLFPKPRLVVIGIIGSAEAVPVLAGELGQEHRHTAWRNSRRSLGSIHSERASV